MNQNRLFTKFTSGLVCSVILTAGAFAQPLDSVVKVFTVASSPSYTLPWMSVPGEGSGSGCVIKGKKILTNAHVVSDETVVMVRKQSSPDKFKARVVAVSHECDLALLAVEDESFFDDLTPLEIAPNLPQLQDPVFVLGYPEGGDTVSFTQGVISRIEVTSYAHSYVDLLALQIDAAINPGNSGGPVINGEHLVGVVMQNLPEAQSVGYAVPTPLIQRFLRDVEDNGKVDGFACLNIIPENLENPALRASKQMKPGQSGMLVTHLVPAATNQQPFKSGDVLLALDGMPVANNGTVAFRKGERVDWRYAMSLKKAGEPCRVSLLRNGQPLELTVPLLPEYQIAGSVLYDENPSYLICGGLVITPLTVNLLIQSEDMRLFYEAMNHEMKSPDEQLLVLVNVLSDDCNIGYNSLGIMMLRKYNGQDILNLKELKAKMDASTEKYHTFEFDQGYTLVLDAEQAKAAMPRIMENYRVPAAHSADL
jgi:S1-C subfamily serine protease